MEANVKLLQIIADNGVLIKDTKDVTDLNAYEKYRIALGQILGMFSPRTCENSIFVNYFGLNATSTASIDYVLSHEFGHVISHREKENHWAKFLEFEAGYQDMNLAEKLNTKAEMNDLLLKEEFVADSFGIRLMEKLEIDVPAMARQRQWNMAMRMRPEFFDDAGRIVDKLTNLVIK